MEQDSLKSGKRPQIQKQYLCVTFTHTKDVVKLIEISQSIRPVRLDGRRPSSHQVSSGQSNTTVTGHSQGHVQHSLHFFSQGRKRSSDCRSTMFSCILDSFQRFSSVLTNLILLILIRGTDKKKTHTQTTTFSLKLH